MRFLNPLKLALPVLALGLLGVPLHAQSQRQQPRSGAGADEQQQQQSQPGAGQQAEPGAGQQQAEPGAGQQQQQDMSVTGKIMKSGNDLVLKDSSTGNSYKIENADQVKQYVGKDVRVVGSVDTSANTIRISRIGVMQSQPPGK